MTKWITDRTYADIEQVKEISAKAKAGTWTTEEQELWAAGMKGALSYMDYNRIESGIKDIANILQAKVSVKTDWDENGYLNANDATRWLDNIKSIRSLCNGKSSSPETPSGYSTLTFYRYSLINSIEQILLDIETVANDHLLYCSEPVCGGEPYYALC